MPTTKRFFIMLLSFGLIVAALAFRFMPMGNEPLSRQSTYSETRDLVFKGTIRALTFYGLSSSVATDAEGVVYRATVPETLSADFAKEAASRGVAVSFEPEEFLSLDGGLTVGAVAKILGNLVVFAIIGGLAWFLVIKGPLANRSKSALCSAADRKVRFADVAGCEGEKQELMEVVEFLRDPAHFERLGGKVPTGVLMAGPPGTGKTLMARAVAGEADVPFFSISGSDFVEMFVGVGAGRVRSAFAEARKKAPCILFIDEIDAVGRARSQGGGGAHEERDQTLNQLLVEMDGFKNHSGVIVIAATNRPEILDPALTRPGRFSRHIHLQNPDLAGRMQVLRVHAAHIELDPEADLLVVARGTTGFSGADLANLVNEAAILAARRNGLSVTMADFDLAKDRVLMGNERRSMVFTEEDRRLTAYHEAGHALVALLSPASDPIHKATIVPRGQALGMVVRLPERDSPAIRRSKIEAELAVALGGRAAEEIIFGPDEITTGASSDIRVASRLARRMVAEWGMSEQLGTITFEPAGYGLAGDGFSEETARQIDAEIKQVIAKARDQALALLHAHLDDLHAIAEALLDRESLSGDEIAALVQGGGDAVRRMRKA